MKYAQYIKENKDIIAMIHVKATPKSPKNKLTPQEIITNALEEAKTYKELGLKTVMIENMHDNPYLKGVGPEVTTLMSVIGHEIKKLGLYCGIQILSHSNKEALAAAQAAGLDFMRGEGFVYAHIGDEGLFESCAGELLRYRKEINAENILIFTDVKKKHSSHSITSDVDLFETAETADFFLSDGIIITGTATGKEAKPEDLKEIESLKTTKLIGSGVTAENFDKYYNLADIFIIGSYFKKDGYWENDLDSERIKKTLEKFEKLK